MTTERVDERAPRRGRLARVATAWTLLGALFLTGLGVGGAFLYRELYSPSAFVERYLTLLQNGRATEALALPGVSTTPTDLKKAGIDPRSSDALLRRDALAPIDDISRVSETVDDDAVLVTMSYTAGGHEGKTTFRVEQNGWLGVVPQWRFARTPLATLAVTVRGADAFDVNGFALDRRQVAPDGVSSDPLKSVDLLVFAPGLYSVKVETRLSRSDGVAVLADKPLTRTPVDIQTEPTKEFAKVVQDRVEDFLASCAKQQVLNPTGCPFGFTVQNLLSGLPTWSITKVPQVEIVPDGSNWGILPAEGKAHITVDVQMIFDGSIRHVDEDVPFYLDGAITVLSDGAVSIRIGTPLDG